MDYTIKPDGSGTGINDQEYTQGIRTGFTVATAVCLVTVYGALGARITMRMREMVRFKADDWLTSIGLVFLTGFAGTCVTILSDGASGQANQYARATLAAEILYTMSLLFVKLSLLILYHRHLSSKPTRIICKGLGVVTILYSIGTLIALLVPCSPHSLTGGTNTHCIDTKRLFLIIGVFDALGLLTNILLSHPIILEHRRTSSIGTRATAGVVVFLGFSTLALINARTAFAYNVQIFPRINLPIASLLALTLLQIISTLLTLMPTFSTTSIEEQSRLPHHHWRAQSGTNLSIHSDTMLFGPPRSSTPQPATLYPQDYRIHVTKEVSYKVEERRGGRGDGTSRQEMDRMLESSPARK